MLNCGVLGNFERCTLSSGSFFERGEEEDIYGTPDAKLVEVYARDSTVYTADSLTSSTYFEAGKISNVGGQQVILLGVKPVQYNNFMKLSSDFMTKVLPIGTTSHQMP